MRITAAGIVPDPCAVGMHVGRVWLARLIAKVAESSLVGRATSHRRRTAIRNESAAEPVRADSTMPRHARRVVHTQGWHTSVSAPENQSVVSYTHP